MKSEKISYLIESNNAEFFLNLGYLNGDVICDTSQIKYILSKNWLSRIFMANFNDSNASENIKKILSKAKELNISPLWFVSPLSHPKNIDEILKENNFIYQNYWTAMAADLKDIPKFSIPNELEIKRVMNLEELKTWTDTLVNSFEFPLMRSYKKYFINAGIGNLNYYLGFIDKKPVATAILFNGKENAGIYYIGTVPQERRKGIALSMLNYILNESKKEGYKKAVLEASQMGYPLYKKAGFKKYHITKIYRWKKF